MPSSASPLNSAFVGEIGVAREELITPVGIYARNWGAATHDVAEGIHRPLTVTALALSSSGDAPLILIGLDLGRWRSRDDEWFVRGAVLDALGLDPARVLIALSHTHAGPGVYREDLDKAGGKLIAPFLTAVRDAVVRAARTALGSCRPARLSWRYGRCDLAKNRDRPEAGSSRYIVGYNPETPADDTLLVGRVEEIASGRTLAVVVNYACHPTTLAWQNRLISPDYPGAMRELVEQTTGATCLFLQGASGELAPAEQYVGDTTLADRHGRRLGHAVLSVLESWPEQALVFDGVVESGAPLAVFRAEPARSSGLLCAILQPVELTLKPLPSIREIEEQMLQCTDRALRERLWRQRGNRLIVGDGTVSSMPLWVWRIGDALLAAQPNEAYSLFQRELRQRFPQRPVAALNLTNGSAGYLPPQDHFGRNEYAVWQSPFAQGSLETVIKTAVAEATRML